MLVIRYFRSSLRCVYLAGYSSLSNLVAVCFPRLVVRYFQFSLRCAFQGLLFRILGVHCGVLLRLVLLFAVASCENQKRATPTASVLSKKCKKLGKNFSKTMQKKLPQKRCKLWQKSDAKQLLNLQCCAKINQ